MQQTALPSDSDTRHQSLLADLQRRIESMGRTTPQTFGSLSNKQLLRLVLGGILGPLMLAWWLL